MQLKHVSFEEVQQQLAKAPYGYGLKGRSSLSDWRSWEAFFNKTACLASIDLQQRFPASMYAFLPSQPSKCVVVVALPMCYDLFKLQGINACANCWTLATERGGCVLYLDARLVQCFSFSNY
jgi:hypothetical protein